MTAKDCLTWHDAYAAADSALSRRLRLVQAHINSWLDDRPTGELVVVSACAGQGHDILGVLVERTQGHRWFATRTREA